MGKTLESLPIAALAAMLLLQCFVQPCAADETETEVTVVTYGSTIKLVHVPTGHRLHSHDIPYGTGSGQQSVTGFHSSGDANSYWLVKHSHHSAIHPTGTSVKCGDTLRMQHLRTQKNLHSHDHRAPLNRDNEVSAYRVGDPVGLVNGDQGDDWVVECARGKSHWGRKDEVRFLHSETAKYLSSSDGLMFNDPIPQQLQVSASSRRNANTVWKTDEGFYMVPENKKN